MDRFDPFVDPFAEIFANPRTGRVDPVLHSVKPPPKGVHYPPNTEIRSQDPVYDRYRRPINASGSSIAGALSADVQAALSLADPVKFCRSSPQPFPQIAACEAEIITHADYDAGFGKFGDRSVRATENASDRTSNRALGKPKVADEFRR